MTGIGAVVLTGIIVFCGIQNSILTVNAADTLFGIERLRQEVQDRGEESPYTILELVPDEAAAEIGYYVPGYEPALSVRSADGSGKWSDWRKGLAELRTQAERTAYMNTLKQKLDSFYRARGFDDRDKVPVSYQEYRESAVPKDGYTRLSFEDEMRYGYFELYGGTGSSARYEAEFEFVGYTGGSLTLQEQCYIIKEATPIPVSECNTIEDEQLVYKKNNPVGGDVSYTAYRWGEVKASVSGGNAAPSVSGGSLSPSAGTAETGYYRLTFEKWNGSAPTRIALYMVHQFTQKENGAYIFKETAEGDGYATAFATESIYYTGGFVNNDWFRRNVVNLEPERMDDFRMQVITLTPAELNALQTANAMPAFDMLYLNSGLQELPHGAGAPTIASYGVGNDLSVAVRNELFTDVISNKKPCIVDASLLYRRNSGSIEYNTDLEATQISYLSALFLQDSPKDFLDRLVDNGTTAAAYPDRADLLKGLYADEDKNFVVEQVYSFFAPTTVVNPDFADFTLYREGQTEGISSGFREVLDEILSENANRLADTTGIYGQLPTDVSQATVVRHIMNYANRRVIVTKTKLNVLELQPCKADTPDLTEDEVIKWAGLEDTEDVSVTIKTMTTAEFIGKIENISEEYDLVYIGTDGDYLNKNSYGNTVFNDYKMDGLIYYHTGDSRVVAMELAGQLLTEYVNGDPGDNLIYYNQVRYGGNDITKEKLNALMDFLNASYPIVVSDECFSVVSLYEDYGWNQEADGVRKHVDFAYAGSYDYEALTALGIGNQTSSFKISDGYQLTLYAGENFTEQIGVYTRDSWTGAEYNDNVKSVRIEPVDGKEQELTVSGVHIDNSSYLYEFLDGAKDKSNFYARSEVKDRQGMFRFYLNRPKLGFEGGAVQVLNASKGVDVNNPNIYILNRTDGIYWLEYKFTIVAEGAASADTRYRCNFYLDVNADGKYSDSEELGDISITYKGNPVAVEELYAGREYVLRRVVPDGYKSVLPWKLQIEQVNNPYVHTGDVGYTKVPTTEIETLKILQICRDYVRQDRDGNGNYIKDRLFNLEEAIADDSNIYNKLINGGSYYNEDTRQTEVYRGIRDQFEIDVDYMTISQYEENFTSGMMGNYNMLILGFSDMYGDIQGDASDKNTPLGAIIDFMNSGKSVLFAHDTVSYFNYEKLNPDNTEKLGQYYIDGEPATIKSNQHHNSHSLTKYARGIVGMDKFGVLSSPILQAGNNLDVSSEGWDILQSRDWNKDVAYVPRSGRTQTYAATHGYTYVTINGRDNKPGEAAANGATYYKEETNWDKDVTNSYLNLDFPTNMRHSPGRDEDGELTYNTNGVVEKLWVTQVNDGQITNYPYKIPETFRVANTHGQYFQLDFMSDADNDGQSDLVVWYCLGGRTGSVGEPYETVYSMSPNDVSNNYYIYNKGNITYTGVGHSGADFKVDEAKLFINTMIASYNAGIKSPSIITLSDGSADATRADYSYSYYDVEANLNYDEDGNPLEGTRDKKRVYFAVNDPNVVKGSRDISVKLFCESKDADAMEISCDDGVSRVRVKELPKDKLAFYTVGGQRVSGNQDLVSGGIYYVEIDEAWLGDYSRFPVYFEVYSTISINGEVKETSPVYHRFDFTKVMMFDLG